ncbi:MAG: AraC family transcriptional regulator [Dysgonamonadaceae bacterium]|jgi:AraC-like DNA-binding protein|nr:AraC family transcriptional regulator [Dysgonamonadaceae bacterium]
MKDDIHIKYLFTTDEDMAWGIVVDSVGFQSIAPGQSYPPRTHPTRYLFSTQKGRVLDEYQLLYIVKGKGRFVSGKQKQKEVGEGNMFLLFPGEWHNYSPDTSAGWDEYWIGFKGVNIDNRVNNGFFHPDKPVFRVGISEELIRMYQSAIETAKRQQPGYQQILAGIVNHILGIMYSQDKLSVFDELKVVSRIEKAKLILSGKFRGEINLEAIAGEVNMSYSWFRRIFKHYTGFTPAQYILTLKILKSKELLTNTKLTAQEIAYDTGFNDANHFFAIFKKKTGMTPIEYRNFTQKCRG